MNPFLGVFHHLDYILYQCYNIVEAKTVLNTNLDVKIKGKIIIEVETIFHRNLNVKINKLRKHDTVVSRLICCNSGEQLNI